MKRFGVALFCLVCAFGLWGCGSGSSPAAATTSGSGSSGQSDRLPIQKPNPLKPQPVYLSDAKQ